MCIHSDSLLELLGNLGGNSIHVGGSLLGEGLSVDGGNTILVLVRDLSNESGSLELNEAVSDALSSGQSRVFGAGTHSLLGRVVLSEGVDSNLTSHVELIGNGGSSNVEPVSVIRSEVLEASCLIVNGPLLNI